MVPIPPEPPHRDAPGRTPTLDEALFLLGERKKELRFLHQLDQALLDANLRPEAALQRVIDALPAAMQFPDIACARIVLPDRTYRSARWEAGSPTMAETIDLGDRSTGRIEACYRINGGGIDPQGDPFLVEEREMLRDAAAALSLYLRFHADESALGRAQAHLKTLESVVNFSPAIAFVWNMTEGWPVAFVSENVRQFGYEAADFRDGTVAYANLVHPDDLDRVAKEVETYISEGRTEFYQRYRIVTRAGAVRWVADWTQVLRDGDGQATQNQGIILDITDRIDAEEKAQRYLNAAGAMFVALDPKGRILAVNDKACDVLGGDADDLIGLDWMATFVPDDAVDDVRRYHAQLSRGEINTDTDEHENDIVTRKGRRLTVHWTNTFERDDTGRITRTISFGTDVTQARKDAARARALALFPQQNPNPVMRIDSQGDLLLANRAAQELMAEIAEDSPEERKKWSALVQAASIARTATTRELAIGLKVILFSIAPVVGEDYTNLYGIDVSRERDHARQLADVANNLQGAVFRYFTHPDGSTEIRSMSAGCFDIWGLTAKEIEADPDAIFRMVHPDDLPGLMKSISASQRGLTEWRGDVRIVSDSGKIKWVRGVGTPRRASNGDIVANVLVLDATAEKEAEEGAKRALHTTIHALAAALEARDPYTAGHEQRVAEIAVKIARRLGMNEHRLEGLELAATIHDVGKIQVPAEILSKPTKLTEPEFNIIQSHPEAGAKLLRDVETQWPLADIVLQHHERLDGSGYPQGLAGEDILFEARILAVADTVEAMASHRPYRAGLGLAAAAEEIRNGAGVRYDPEVAQACLDLIDSDDVDLFK